MGIFSKIFGDKRSQSELLLEDTLSQVLEKADFDLNFDIKVSSDEKEVLFDLFGDDESLAKDKDGQLMDALQLFLRRVQQNKVSEERVNVIVDSGTFREDADQALIDLAEKLKGVCLKKNKPVYFRAFPPRERKIIHQYLSEDDTVKSKSVGDGLFKKIKIFPANYKGKRRAPKKEVEAQAES